LGVQGSGCRVYLLLHVFPAANLNAVLGLRVEGFGCRVHGRGKADEARRNARWPALFQGLGHRGWGLELRV